MATFAELMTQYTLRIGIADAELARKIGVRRQTIFRWKEGLVQRPRDRDVVLDIAKALRLTPEERDGLLLAAGFAPESMPEAPAAEDFPTEIAGAEIAGAGIAASGVEASGVEASGVEASSSIDADATVPSLVDDAPVSVSITIPEDGSRTQEKRNEGFASPRVQRSMKRLLWISGVATLTLIGLVYWTFFGIGDNLPAQIEATELAQSTIDLVDSPTSSATSLPAETTESQSTEPQLTEQESTAKEPSKPDLTASKRTGLAATSASITPPICESKTDDEILVLIARFVPYGTKRFNVAGRILEALEDEARGEDLAALRVALVKEEISSRTDADFLMAECPAAVLIWGEYDDGRVVAQTTSIRESRIQFPADLSTAFDVNVPAEVRILALEALGLVLRGEDRYGEAAAAFERALSPHPDAPPNVPTDSQRFNLNFYLGYSLYNEGVQSASRQSLESAIAAYDNALNLASTLKRSGQVLFYNRGIAYLDLYRGFPDEDAEKGSLDLAIADLDAALRIKGRPWDPLPAYTTRGIAHMTRNGEGDTEAAIRDYSAAIALNPKPDYYFNRALGHIAANNVASWEVDLDKSLELGYPARNIYTAKCYAHLRQIQAAEAIAACEMAIDQEPKAADTAYVNYAIALAFTGEDEKAIQYLTEHIEWLNATSGRYQRLQGKLADEWLVQLNAGEQPFTEETLRNLE